MQQFDEEEIGGELNNEQVVDVPEEILDPEEEGIEEATVEEPVNKKADKSRAYPSNKGVILTIFSAIVLVLLGGLASYYYYTFQSEGRESTQAVKSIWEEVVDESEDVLSATDRVDKYVDLAKEGDDGVVAAVAETNRVVRDSLFDLRNQTGIDVKTSTVISKLSGFLEDYGAWLAELRLVAERATDTDSEEALAQLKALNGAAEESYDELLAVNAGVLRANLPRLLFELPTKLEEKLKSKLEDDKKQSEADKSNQRAAETVVSKFAQAWQEKDAEAMANLLTSGAKNEFNPGMVEDSVEVIGLAITGTEVSEDKTQARVTGSLKKRTPDGVAVSENWRFGLRVVDNVWLIDSFDPA